MSSNPKHKRQRRHVIGGAWEMDRSRHKGKNAWQDEENDRLVEEETPYNPRLKQTILEIVENQLRAHDPPEVAQTLKRLLSAGHSRQQAVEKIGSALTEEIWSMLHEKKPYDHERYIGLLEQLKEDKGGL